MQQEEEDAQLLLKVIANWHLGGEGWWQQHTVRDSSQLPVHGSALLPAKSKELAHILALVF